MSVWNNSMMAYSFFFWGGGAADLLQELEESTSAGKVYDGKEE